MKKKDEKKDGGKIIVTINPGRRAMLLDRGENIYSALVARKIHLQGPCQGRGLCGQCRIMVDPLLEASEADNHHLTPSEIEKGWTLACQREVTRPMTISLPETSRKAVKIFPGRRLYQQSSFLRISHRGKDGPVIASGGRIIEQLQGSEKQPLIAAAVDLGTTNISLQLVDIGVPSVLGTASILNPQVRHGEDVISRIKMSSDPSGRKVLRKMAIEAINNLIEALTEKKRAVGPVYETFLAANPVMASIMADIDPSPLARPPFRLPPLPPALEDMSEAGLKIHRRALVRLLPPLGSFVGGDVTAGLVFKGVLPEDERITFYLDLGTNGEIILKKGFFYLAASTAAGPALEGRNISSGMRADEGAIDCVVVEGDMKYTVIGGAEPVGICGSGLLDLLAGLLHSGLVHPDGRLMDASELAHFPNSRLASRIVQRNGQQAFLIHEKGNQEIFLSQADIRELQLMKGAVRAGISILLKESHLEEADVERVIISGVFGFHLRSESVSSLGFLPPAWEDKIEFAGNASLEGARECLIYRESYHRCSVIADLTRTINLAEHPDFKETFMASLDFR